MMTNEQVADEVVTRLYRRFKEWSARGFGPEDVTWCEVKADILQMIAESRVEPRGEWKDGGKTWEGEPAPTFEPSQTVLEDALLSAECDAIKKALRELDEGYDAAARVTLESALNREVTDGLGQRVLLRGSASQEEVALSGRADSLSPAAQIRAVRTGAEPR